MLEDRDKLVEQRVRFSNQLTSTLKDYFPQALDAFGSITNKSALEFLTRFDTHQEVKSLSAEEMLSHFKGQDKIEKHIGTFKGPIRIRPMFLHKQERIESLVFICMLALLVYSILEMEAKHANIVMTGENILKQFQTSDLGSRGYPLRLVYTIFKDGSIWKQVAPLTEFQSKFIEKLGLPDPVIYLEHIKLE